MSLRARSGHVLMIGAAVLWGTVGLVVLRLHDDAGLSATQIACLRSVVAALALGAGLAALARRTTAGAGTTRARPGRGLVVAIGAGTAAFQTLYFAAVPMVGVAVATLLGLGLAPLFVAAGETLLLGVRHSRRVGLAVGASVAGLALLVAPGGTAGDGPWLLGCGLAALSAAGYAAVTLLTRARAGAVDTGALSAGAFAVGAVLLAPTLAGGDLPADAQSLGLLLYLGLVPSALAYAMFFTALRTVPATVSAVAVLLEPVTAALLAWVLIGERLGTAGLAGGALVLAAVAVAAMDRTVGDVT
ncbi:MAG TPA: EamA family transporter [Solirubrobacteraceae bacterium]